jgi:hypothetical protein
MFRDTRCGNKLMLAAVLACSMGASSAFSQSSQAAPSPAAPVKPAAVASASSRFASSRLTREAEMYYLALWGVDSFKIKYTESGEMIRFTWRVVDPVKAAQLNDKKAEPFLYDPQARVKLVVPQMEKVGQLRQSSTPIAGRSYWMAFANNGRRVRPGDRVSIEIGQFRAINLAVE